MFDVLIYKDNMLQKIKYFLNSIVKKTELSYKRFLTTLDVIIKIEYDLYRYIKGEIIHGTVSIIIFFIIYSITAIMFDFFFTPDLGFDDPIIQEEIRRGGSNYKSEQGIDYEQMIKDIEAYEQWFKDTRQKDLTELKSEDENNGNDI